MASSGETSSWNHGVDRLIADLGSQGPSESAARAALVALAADRVHNLAHRMLSGSPRLRRWEQTDDVVQGAMLRLHRALGVVVPNDVQHFLRLAALQVRRELIDLGRRHSHGESMAANHETNSFPGASDRQQTDQAIDRAAVLPDRLSNWTRFHELAASLPTDQRELFDMVWYLGMTQDEIAAVLECSPRTIRRRWEETKRVFSEAFLGHAPE